MPSNLAQPLLLTLRSNRFLTSTTQNPSSNRIDGKEQRAVALRVKHTCSSPQIIQAFHLQIFCYSFLIFSNFSPFQLAQFTVNNKQSNHKIDAALGSTALSLSLSSSVLSLLLFHSSVCYIFSSSLKKKKKSKK